MKKKIKIFTDGGSRGNPGLAGGGVFVFDELSSVIFEGSYYFGIKTNNEAEYLSFLNSLNWLKDYQKSAEIESAEWLLDSKLVVEQMNRKWKVKDLKLKLLYNECLKIWDSFMFKKMIIHIARDLNKKADLLANQAIDSAAE